MAGRKTLLLLAALGLGLGCGGKSLDDDDDVLKCEEGTHEEDGECVPDTDDTDDTDDTGEALTDDTADTDDTDDTDDTGEAATDDTAPVDETCDTGVLADTGETPATELCAFDEADLVTLAADSFTRDDNDDLGATEEGDFAYVEASGHGSGYVTIGGGSMLLHYFAGDDGSVPDQWVNIGRLDVADLVLDVRLATYSEYYGGLFGLSYRLPTQDGVQGRGGYHVLMEVGTLTLYAGHVALDSAEVGDDYSFHDYRVVANGDAHCVYMDGTLVLSARDSTYSRPGYIGAKAYYSIGFVDDLTVSAHPEPRSEAGAAFDLWDDFARADDAALGSTTSGGETWTETEDDGSASVADESLALEGAESAVSAALADVDHAALEFAFSVTADSLGGDAWYGAWIRGDDAGPDPGGSGVRLDLDGSTAALTVDGQILSSATAEADGETHDYRLLASGRTVRVYRDGVELLEVTDDTNTDPGSVGLFARDVTLAVDDVGMRALDPDPVFPQGALEFPAETRFPVLFYSVAGGYLDQAVARGANIVHAYGEDDGAYVEVAGLHGVRALGHVGTYSVGDGDDVQSAQDDVVPVIERIADGQNLGWWEYPEELRHWRSNELSEMSNLYDWTRANDPDQSPTWMYQAGHYDAEALAYSVPFVDIIGKGSYVDYAGQPRAWVRHQLESTIEGIGLAGYAVGPDYLAGERVPLLVVGVWQAFPTTAAEIYHDVYSGIASGARGIALYSYAHGVDSASGDGLDGFLQAAEELTTHDGPLGPVVLFGESTDEVDFEITDGATLTDEFTPYGAAVPEQYDCLNLAAWDHDDQRWVVAVNSCEEPLVARLSGFTGGPEVVLPYEDRVLCLDDEGVFEDDFEALGVHVYRVDGP
jgi:hypothetical protein